MYKLVTFQDFLLNRIIQHNGTAHINWHIYYHSQSYGNYEELFNFPILSLAPYTNVYFTSTTVNLRCQSPNLVAYL